MTLAIIGGGGGGGGPGSRWYSDAGAPGTISGQANGDHYLDTATGDIYELIAGTWTLQGNIQGPEGPAGAAGATGDTGPAGPGLAPGGTTGQIAAKASDTDYDVEWIDAPTGGGGGGEPLEPLIISEWDDYATYQGTNPIYTKAMGNMYSSGSASVQHSAGWDILRQAWGQLQFLVTGQGGRSGISSNGFSFSTNGGSMVALPIQKIVFHSKLGMHNDLQSVNDSAFFEGLNPGSAFGLNDDAYQSNDFWFGIQCNGIAPTTNRWYWRTRTANNNSTWVDTTFDATRTNSMKVKIVVTLNVGSITYQGYVNDVLIATLSNFAPLMPANIVYGPQLIGLVGLATSKGFLIDYHGYQIYRTS
jgi:hypothetical protein